MYFFLYVMIAYMSITEQALAQYKEKSFQKQTSLKTGCLLDEIVSSFVTEVLKQEQVVVERILLKNQA